MASIKALDGRMFYGIASWIFVWCVDAPVLISEHPRSYVEDFYDAPRRLTNLSFFGCDWHKPTMLYHRGVEPPVPTTPGNEGNLDWHNRGGTGLDRDETPIDMARALAEVVSAALTARAAEGSQSEPPESMSPRYEVEIERFAAAW